MAEVLKPDKNSRDNIMLFLVTVEDQELRQLLVDNLDNILAVGADLDSDRGHRTAFFDAVTALIDHNLEGVS